MKKLFSILAVLIITASMSLSGCNQPYSTPPAVTNTPIPTEEPMHYRINDGPFMPTDTSVVTPEPAATNDLVAEAEGPEELVVGGNGEESTINYPDIIPQDLRGLPVVWNDDSKGSGTFGIVTSVAIPPARMNFEWPDTKGPMTMRWYITNPTDPDYILVVNPGVCYDGLMLTGDDQQYATVECDGE